MNKKIIQQICLSFLLVLTLVCIPVTGVQAQTQKVSIKMENVRMKQVMNEIERQTKFLFGINDDVDVNRLVTVNVTNQSLQAALDQMVKGTDITYQISSSNIILSKKQAKLPVDISGTIRDINGSPIVGATIVIRGTSIGISSGSDGSFSLQIPPPAASRQLEVSYLGYETLVVDVGNRTAFDLTLQESSAEIEQVVVTALGIKRSEKAVAYNVQQVKAEDLTTVKDANFINSLTGKVAGVTINTSSSGISGYRQFEYPFIARAEGTYEVEPVEFSYFDPARMQYMTLRSRPLELEITPDAKGGGGDAYVVQGRGMSKEEVKMLGQDIRFIKLGNAQLRPVREPFLFGAVYWVLLFGILAFFTAVYVALRKQIRESQNAALVRGKRANKVAVQRFRVAKRYMEEQNRHAFYEEMLRALWGYMGDKFNIPVANLTKENVREELHKRGVSVEESQRFTSIITKCDEAQYSPAASAQMSEVYAEGVDIISRIEAVIKR